MQPLNILLASPRGFCAGVDRAVKIVERALEKYGAPVYVRHEIVHNKFVVDSLKAKGAVFVEELDDIPAAAIADKNPVIFSAHGVPKSVPADAIQRNLHFVDATCPLVSKVHRGAERWFEQGYHILLIGHKGHPEVIGTMGQLPEGSMTLVETVADVATITPPTDKLAYATQTTLSLDETADIVTALQARFPTMAGPKKSDICYATTNRQQAVRNIAPRVDAFVVIGAENSSNSKRLVETAKDYGCPKAMLIAGASGLDRSWLHGVQTLGVSAGASAPEELVSGVINQCREWFEVSISETGGEPENVVFHLPKELRQSKVATA